MDLNAAFSVVAIGVNIVATGSVIDFGFDVLSSSKCATRNLIIVYGNRHALASGNLTTPTIEQSQVVSPIAGAWVEPDTTDEADIVGERIADVSDPEPPTYIVAPIAGRGCVDDLEAKVSEGRDDLNGLAACIICFVRLRNVEA